MKVRNPFQAIADPTRRAIIGIVAEEPQTVNAIAEKFHMSRQAVSLHVKVLEDCGLIIIKRRGRYRYCEAQLDQLSKVWAWVDQYRSHWEGKPEPGELFVKTKKGAIGNSKPADGEGK